MMAAYFVELEQSGSHPQVNGGDLQQESNGWFSYFPQTRQVDRWDFVHLRHYSDDLYLIAGYTGSLESIGLSGTESVHGIRDGITPRAKRMRNKFPDDRRRDVSGSLINPDAPRYGVRHTMAGFNAKEVSEETD